MNPRILIHVIAITLLATLLASVPTAQDQQEHHKQNHYFVFLLSTLGGTGGQANSINNRGWVTGAANLKGDATEHTVLWLHGAKFDLGTLGGPNSAVLWPVHNNRGQIAGVSDTSIIDPLGENWSCGAFFPPSHAGHTCLGFLWQDGAMTALPTLGGNNGFATGVNNRGQIVGWAENATHDATCVSPQVLQFEAVVWGPRKGQMRELPPLAADQDGAATAINDKSQVVGISGICQNAVGALSAKHALLWENGIPTAIGNLGGAGWNTPMDINNRGQVVGFSDLPGDENAANPNFHAFLWTKEGGIQDLKTLPRDAISEALGINERGQVVGLSFTAGFASSRAFIWQDGAMRDLNTLVPPSPWVLIDAQDINNRGEIVGVASNSGTQETGAFLAVPSPFGVEAAPSLAQAAGNEALKLVLPERVRKQLLSRLGLSRLETIQ
jgi:probable HAF family extracellular repeat protein